NSDLARRGAIPQDCNSHQARKSLLEQLEPLWREFLILGINPCDVPAWMCEAGHKPGLDRIITASHDNRDGLGCSLCRVCRRRIGRHNDINPEADKFSRKRRQLIREAIRGPALDECVLALDIA